MTSAQALILSSNSFDGKPDEQGVKKTLYYLTLAKYDAHNHITTNNLYVEKDVFESFSDIGVYDTNWSVYFNNKSEVRTKLIGIKLIKKVDL